MPFTPLALYSHYFTPPRRPFHKVNDKKSAQKANWTMSQVVSSLEEQAQKIVKANQESTKMQEEHLAISRSTAKLLADGAARDETRDAKTEAHRQRQHATQAERNRKADIQVLLDAELA